MRAYLFFWFFLAILANANGVLRAILLEPHLQERTAHQLSTLTLIALVTVATFLFARRYPPSSSRQAVTLGITWVLLTVAFEFGFGRFVVGHSWDRLLADYDLAAGRIWPVFLLWLGLLPLLAWSFRHQRGGKGTAGDT